MGGTPSERYNRPRYNGVKHGYSTGGKRKPVYVKWQMMCQRVRKPASAYRHVTMCKRWEKFENFLADMGEPPTGYSLDRIDNNKGYFPSNCRWIPSSRQGANRRNNKVATVNGIKATLTDHARRVNLNPYIVLTRVKAGWSVEDALSKPVRKYSRANIGVK